jgi:hypothetical protein
MKTIIIKEADYNVWHMDAKGEVQNAKKRISQGLIIIFILTFYRMLCILAHLKSEAVGQLCGACGIQQLCPENIGGTCIGLFGFNRGNCKSIVCDECFMGKFNCPFCQIKAEAESWTTVRAKNSLKVKISTMKKSVTLRTTTATPNSARTTSEKLNSSNRSKSGSSKLLQSPSTNTDRLLLGTH